MLKHVLSALGGAVVGAAIYSARQKPPAPAAEGTADKAPASTAPPPPSAFFLFCEDNAGRAKEENPGHHQIQGVLNQEWEALSDEARQPFEERHAVLLAAYEAAGGGEAAEYPPPRAYVHGERFELQEPGPMLPPVPAVILGVAGDDTRPPDLTIVWSFVIDGPNAQIGSDLY